MADKEDYTVKAKWPSGRIGVTQAVDPETADLFKDFAISAGAEWVKVMPPEGFESE